MIPLCIASFNAEIMARIEANRLRMSSRDCHVLIAALSNACDFAVCA